MKKSTKILFCVVAAVLVVCVGIIGIYSAVSGRDIGNTPTDAMGNTVISNDSQQNSSAQSTTSAPTLDALIIGKWMDSANMSGFEFIEGGIVNVTYVNLTIPVINFPINGTAKGSYTLSGDQLTVNFSIYKKTISNTYTAYVSNPTLTLTSRDDGEISTYEKQTGENTAGTTSSSSDTLPNATEDGIFGTWQNSDGSIMYTFNKTGILNISFKNADIDGQKYSDNCDGVFILSGEDKITIQYSVLSKQITEEYTYSLSGNSLELKNSSNEKLLFVRSQSSSSSNELIGSWQDSSKMSGFNFKEDGSVDLTYVNFTVPVVNIPINGTFPGSYSIDGDKLKISVSIYSKSIENVYTYKIEGNTLSLTNTEDGKTTVYTK